MKIKCDTCKWRRMMRETCDTVVVALVEWCGKRHWEGVDPTPLTEDPWANCPDYERNLYE